MTLGQRVAVMRKGELQQVAAPAGALHAPGEPLRRRLHRQPGHELLRGARSRSATDSARCHLRRRSAAHGRRRGGASLPAALPTTQDGSVVVGVRPEHLEDASLARDTPPTVGSRASCASASCSDRSSSIHFEVEAAPVVTEETRDLAEDVDASALTELDHLRSARRTSFVGRFAAEAPTEEDTVAEIAVAPAPALLRPRDGRPLLRRRESGRATGSRHSWPGRGLTSGCTREDGVPVIQQAIRKEPRA